MKEQWWVSRKHTVNNSDIGHKIVLILDEYYDKKSSYRKK